MTDGVNSTSFDVTNGGIYYLDQAAGETRLRILIWPRDKPPRWPGTLETRTSAWLPHPMAGRLLFTRIDSSVNDLMLVENFR